MPQGVVSGKAQFLATNVWDAPIKNSAEEKTACVKKGKVFFPNTVYQVTSAVFDALDILVSVSCGPAAHN